MAVASQMSAPGPLAGLSVVELGDGTAGPYAAKLLGDFGAEVIKVEGPDGDFDAATRAVSGRAGRIRRRAGCFCISTSTSSASSSTSTGRTGSWRCDRLLADADVFITNLPVERLRAAGAAPTALRARSSPADRDRDLAVRARRPLGRRGAATSW